MAKVKQAIIDVEEEVMEIVMSRTSLERGNETISLQEVKTILFKQYFHKADTGYFLDETVVKNAYKNAVYEKENDEEYDEYR